MKLYQLPPEIHVQILQKLDIDELFSYQPSSKYIDHLTRDSVMIQRKVALDTTMAQVNPCAADRCRGAYSAQVQ